MIEVGIELVGQHDEAEWLGVYELLALPRVGETLFVTTADQDRLEARVLRIVHVSERVAKPGRSRAPTQVRPAPSVSLYVETLSPAVHPTAAP